MIFRKVVSLLDEEFNLVMQAEKKNYLLYVHKGNALKRKSNETKSNIKGLKEALQTLQEKQKNATLIDLFHQQCFIDIMYLIYFIYLIALPLRILE